MALIRRRVILCPICKRRRRCTQTRVDQYYEFRCSQTHVWQVEVGAFEKVSEVLKAFLVPQLTDRFFNNDTLLQSLKGRR